MFTETTFSKLLVSACITAGFTGYHQLFFSNMPQYGIKVLFTFIPAAAQLPDCISLNDTVLCIDDIYHCQVDLQGAPNHSGSPVGFQKSPVQAASRQVIAIFSSFPIRHNTDFVFPQICRKAWDPGNKVYQADGRRQTPDRIRKPELFKFLGCRCEKKGLSLGQ